LEKLRKFGGHKLAEDILSRVSGKKSVERCAARRSVHSATDGDTSWCDDTSRCDDGSSGNGTCDDRGTARGDATCPVHTSSADDGVSFHRA
jgi:hypothetical protein